MGIGVFGDMQLCYYVSEDNSFLDYFSVLFGSDWCSMARKMSNASESIFLRIGNWPTSSSEYKLLPWNLTMRLNTHPGEGGFGGPRVGHAQGPDAPLPRLLPLSPLARRPGRREAVRHFGGKIDQMSILNLNTGQPIENYTG